MTSHLSSPSMCLATSATQQTSEVSTDFGSLGERQPRTFQPRRGFTLVEMLVAVGLVVLMMFLFVQIFSMATGAMSKQKGLAENDQKARLATTAIQSDLQKRTFRWVYPMPIGQDPRYPSLQQGYFSISENDPTDDTDDVLTFTILTSITTKNTDTTPVYGRATWLQADPPSASGTGYQQPEYDDGLVQTNNSSSSTVAEISYFLRKGVLYRRVMLVRVPYVGSNPKPVNNDGTDILTNGYSTTFAPSGSNVFWRDFDYSAVNLGGYATPYSATPSTSTPVTFLGAASGSNALSNTYSGVAAGTPVFQLGMPNLRFGHNVHLTGTTAGSPREYVTKYIDNTGTQASGYAFIGRFTHEETSHDSFAYPGKWTSTTDYPMQDTNLVLDSDGVIQKFRAGPRRGEDLLMANVHAFDIKVFDNHPNVKDYRDLGYGAPNGQRGFYWRGACQNKYYGPRSPGPGADGQPGEAGVDDDGDGNTDNNTELGWPGTDDVANNVFDTWHPDFLVDGDGDGNADSPPYSPDSRGPDLQPGRAGVDDDGNGSIDDTPMVGTGELGWPGTDDYTPLQSIQIRLRYLDPVSNQMRDVTLVQSLVD